MKVLLVDNYDSFTFNLYQLAAEVFGPVVTVVPNDTNWESIIAQHFDAVIISPGPGRPDREADFGISRLVLERMNVPILGVCLGHQGICDYFGAEVIHAPKPMHGRVQTVFHSGAEMFAGIPREFKVVRYHSLMSSKPLPECLVETCSTSDGIIMGVQHRSRPIWGVQFHPESICTEYGRELLQNFRSLVTRSLAKSTQNSANTGATPFRVKSRSQDLTIQPEAVFDRLFSDLPYCFWLDSSLSDDTTARFSFMGGYKASDLDALRYFVPDSLLEICSEGRVRSSKIDLFDYLHTEIAEQSVKDAEVNLPFEFRGGYLGYFGYELKALTGGKAAHTSDIPDAYLFHVTRFCVIDHAANTLYFVAIERPGEEESTQNWFAGLQARLRTGVCPEPEPVAGSVSRFEKSLSESQYLDRIGSCMDAIRDGESYEVCLTNQFAAQAQIDPLTYYRYLRRKNPAPYSSFFRFPELSIASSSPERFLKISTAGEVETKPIKGTVRRGKDAREDERLKTWLAEEEKNRSENLMIVDLLRNDLGRVCDVGSVIVPKLMHVETYATVHQLVSTVTGRLKKDKSPVDCIRAAFPGGSMTGAPKIRTMEIIDSLEKVARGVYSGSIGYLSFNGAVDLNIVIRTAVFTQRRVRIGVGGAVIALSDPKEEWDEILLKSKALVDAFEELAAEREVEVTASTGD